MPKKRKLGPPPLGHVVEDFMIGNTHILICDDACRDMTPEDTQRVLDSIAKAIAPAYFAAKAARNEL
jgi:hypothetical protein